MSNFYPYINIHTHRRVENEISIEIIGVHPYDAESGMKLSRESIGPDVEAIGEIGIDFSRPIDKERQESLLCEQLRIAEEMNLPVVIHAVRAVARCVEILEKFSLRAAIFHGFIGSEQQAQAIVNKGYFISFGHRCFDSPKTLRALRSVPLTSIFFETDDHDISIAEIYERGTQFRDESLEEIREQIYKNYTKIFK